MTTEQTSTQAQLLFARALEDQDLLGPDGLPLDRDPEDPPILVAWSDNGSEMTAVDTRQFMALYGDRPASRPARHPDRPGAHRIVLQPPEGRSRPHLTEIRDPAALYAELARIRREYNTVQLHAAIGYVTPDDEHHGRGPAIRRARTAGLRRARAERIKQNRASKK